MNAQDWHVDELMAVIRRAAAVASDAETMSDLLRGALDLLLEAAGVEWGWIGVPGLNLGSIGLSVQRGEGRAPNDPDLQTAIAEAVLSGHLAPFENDLLVPFVVNARCSALALLCDAADALSGRRGDELRLISERLAGELRRAHEVEEARRREQRQETLVAVIGKLTATLEPDDLLDVILQQACSLLDAEASSIWLRERNGDLVLHLVSRHSPGQMSAVRLPAGSGIIGHVVETGETVVVNDVQSDHRFYRQVDEKSGFVTRSVLSVPLRAPQIHLGGERGEVAAQIIGGMQVLNPRLGRLFTPDDVALCETLAVQAATILRLAGLYEETNRLFNRIIDAITGAIDLKDTYTRGHSQRVSDYSVAIANELGLSQEQIYRLRIASKLHDVGKIRVPDHILKKEGRLTEEERAEIERHPTYGVDFLRENGLLDLDLLSESWQALAEHHERLDGNGYPAGLHGHEISLFGRIVAVADVFDAITSNRPYQPGRPAELAITILRDGIDSAFDRRCVEALISARQKGFVFTQAERETTHY